MIAVSDIAKCGLTTGSILIGMPTSTLANGEWKTETVSEVSAELGYRAVTEYISEDTNTITTPYILPAASIYNWGHAASYMGIAPIGTSNADDVLVGHCLSKVKERVAYLGELLDEDGLEYSQKSEAALISFIESYGIKKRPLVSVLDSGNFSARWKDESGQRVVVNFVGEEDVQFVLFAERAASDKLAVLHGSDVFGGVIKNITANGLDFLL